MSRTPAIRLVVAFLASLAGSASAQAPNPERASWLPRQLGPFTGLSAGQRAAAISTLERAEQLFRQVPELAHPEGFEVQPVLSGGARQLGPGDQPLPGVVAGYRLTLMFFYPSKAAAGEGCGCISVTVNAPQTGNLYAADGRQIYIEDARATRPRGTPDETRGILWEVPAATQVYGELWEPSRDIREGRGERSGITALFVAGADLPWLPVSREVFYQANLRSIEGENGKQLAEFRAAMAKTPYQEWMEGAAQRQKDREETLRNAASVQSAAELEKTRESLERSEREVTERLRKTDEADRARNEKALAASFGPRNAMAAELDRMTPAERAMPTYINNALTEGPNATGWRLTSDPAPPAWRVLTPNYDFYRIRRSSAEVRSITVNIAITGTGLRPPVRQALLHTFKKLDWAAFSGLLNRSQ